MQFGLTGTIQLTKALPALSANVTVIGPGATSLTIEGGGKSSNYSVLTINKGVTAAISGLTISGGNTNAGGGGINNLGTMTLTDCTVENDSASAGGGIYSTGTMTVTGCTVEQVAGTFGGGVTNYIGGTAVIVACTITDNTAANQGGGISTYGPLKLINSTIVGNTAGAAGGVYVDLETGSAVVTNCTITGNRASGNSGGGIVAWGPTILNNTIVCGNFGGAAPSTTPNDIAKLVNTVSSNNNLIGTGGSGGLTNGFQGNLVGITNPGLGTLGDNGGATQTVPLVAGSLAIDAGDSSKALDASGQPLTTDQRGVGFPRILGASVDIGAFEFAQPSATTVAATSITSMGAILNASVNPEGSATNYSFEYSTDPTLTLDEAVTIAQSAGSGLSSLPESVALTGLTPNTTYYFEALATDAGGTVFGKILNFTTLPLVASPPIADTLAATSITDTGATLNASVNPKGTVSSFTFVYGTDPTLTSGTMSTTAQSAGSGSSDQPEAADLTGLTANTTYYFRVQATSAAGTTDGAILNFTTSPLATLPPSADTLTATSVTATGATLNASVNPEGSQTSYTFVYGTDPTLTSGTMSTTAQSAGSGSGDQAEAIAVSGLNVGKTYYYRVVATNSGGTSLGSIASFATPAVIQFSGGQFAADVKSGTGDILLTRAGDLSGMLTVTLSSPGGHEVAGFVTVITFGPGEESKVVPIAMVNDGQPGEDNTVIALALSAPSVGATLGATATASLVIVDNNPPNVPITSPTSTPAVTITSLSYPTLNVGMGKTAKRRTVLEVQFSGPVIGAGNLGAYVLESGKTKKGRTTYTRSVPLSSAVYNYPGTQANSLTLFLKNKLNLSIPEQLTVNAGLITDPEGRHLSHNYLITFSNKGVTIE